MKLFVGSPVITLILALIFSSCGGGGEGSPSPPLATTGNAVSVTQSGAVLNGTVNPRGTVVDAWFEYGTSPTLATYDNTATQNFAAGSGSQLVDQPLSGLAPGTTYYFRLAAYSGGVWAEGSISSFQTLPGPAATTDNATNITTTGATFNGTVNPNGFPAEAWFEYGLDNSLATFTKTPAQFQGSGTTTLPVSATPIAPLTSWSTYYFRMVARSTADNGVFTKWAIHNFPTGEYYVAVGDSITHGSHDDFPSDDTSLDGRNSGGGFEPILNNRLTAGKGYPHTVVNAGVSGTTSADGAASISSTLSIHPSAKYCLILYGSNDASFPVPKATYKANMQSIIDTIKAAGKTPFLAKVPYASDPGFSDASIQDYNTAIDELVLTNNISVVPPDYYAHFKAHPEELADGVHLDGTGYQSMANLWFSALQ